MIKRENRRPTIAWARSRPGYIDYGPRERVREYYDAAAMNIYLRIRRSPSKRSYRMLPRSTVFYSLHCLLRMTSLCTLRTKLTRNLDAWPAGKKICILCTISFPEKPSTRRARGIRAIG